MTYKVPEGWEVEILENVLEKLIDYRGKTPKKSDFGIPTLSAKSVKNNYIDYSNVYYISEEEYNRFMNRGKPKVGDVVMTTEAPLGLVTELKTDKIALAQRIITMRGMENKLYNSYLKYFLQSPIGQHELESRATGTTVVGISQKNLIKCKVILPPLQEQKAIADTLSAIDDKIELNNKINQNLEAQAQAIFKSWFIDFEPFQDGEFVESELGMIPKGWEVVTLGDIISICNGKRPKEKVDIKDKKNKYPILGASGVMGYTNDYMYNEPILVIGRVGTHGVVQKVSDKVWTSDNTMIIKTTYYEFVNQVLLGLDYKSLNRGSTQPLLAQKDIKNQKIAIPYKNKDTLNLFENILSKYRRQIDNLEIQNQTLSQLRDTLLPKLISGEIRIPLEE